LRGNYKTKPKTTPQTHPTPHSYSSTSRNPPPPKKQNNQKGGWVWGGGGRGGAGGGGAGKSRYGLDPIPERLLLGGGGGGWGGGIRRLEPGALPRMWVGAIQPARKGLTTTNFWPSIGLSFPPTSDGGDDLPMRGDHGRVGDIYALNFWGLGPRANTHPVKPPPPHHPLRYSLPSGVDSRVSRVLVVLDAATLPLRHGPHDDHELVARARPSSGLPLGRLGGGGGGVGGGGGACVAI